MLTSVTYVKYNPIASQNLLYDTGGQVCLPVFVLIVHSAWNADATWTTEMKATLVQQDGDLRGTSSHWLWATYLQMSHT